jgi:hypothetical protein
MDLFPGAFSCHGKVGDKEEIGAGKTKLKGEKYGLCYHERTS